MTTGAPSPGSVALPAVLEVKLPAAPGTVYPVPEGFVDNEVLTELVQPIMDAPVLDASKLALQWSCRPRRGVSVVGLEKLSGDGPIRADMSRLMKVRSCTGPGRRCRRHNDGEWSLRDSPCARVRSHVFAGAPQRGVLGVGIGDAVRAARGRERGRDLSDGDAAQLMAVSPPRASNDVAYCNPCGSWRTPVVPGPGDA